MSDVDHALPSSPPGGESTPWTGRERLVAALLLLALGTWFLPVPGGRLAAAIVFLVAVPASLVGLYLTRGRVPSSCGRTGGTRRVAAALAWVLVVLAWIPAAGLATLLFLLTEPWPLSRRHGPDTGHARALFERYAGAPPPPTVSGLYARNEWAGPGEHVTSMRFHTADLAVVEGLVERLRLVPVPAAEVPALASFPGPSWWPEEALLAAAPEAYRLASGSHPQCFVHLWVDRASGTVWFQDVDVA